MDYDPLAADYAWHRRASRTVVEALVTSLPPGATVLEIGCGTANHLAAISAAVCVETVGRANGTRSAPNLSSSLDRVRSSAATSRRSIGVDPSAAMLAVARRRLQDAGLARGLAERLPIADGSVDLAFSVDVIHHVGDVAAYFTEAARVLRPGGRLCTVTDSAATIRGRQPLATYFPAIVDVELARYPSLAALVAAARVAGLTAEAAVETEEPYVVRSAAAYRDKAMSSLHLVPPEEYDVGLARLERDLAAGPIRGVARNVLLWATAG